MERKKVFIDGEYGTTGMIINKILAEHSYIDVISIDKKLKKNIEARTEVAKNVDAVILCLPDLAAKEAVAVFEVKTKAKIIDASSAHRTNPNWTYGLAEMNSAQRERIAQSRMISNPGCYPIGVILLLKPLIERGLLSTFNTVNVIGVSGYTGGGDKMVSQYNKNEALGIDNIISFKPYSLTNMHKHIPEMSVYSGFHGNINFLPSVCHNRQGMIDIISLPVTIDPKITFDLLHKAYGDEFFVTVHNVNDEDVLQDNFFDMSLNNNTNNVDLFIYSNNFGTNLIACYDNLGKGAARNAVQNLNLVMGFPENTGLC